MAKIIISLAGGIGIVLASIPGALAKTFDYVCDDQSKLAVVSFVSGVGGDRLPKHEGGVVPSTSAGSGRRPICGRRCRVLDQGPASDVDAWKKRDGVHAIARGSGQAAFYCGCEAGGSVSFESLIRVVAPTPVVVVH